MRNGDASRRAFLQDNAGLVYDDGYSVVLGNPDGDLTLVEFFDYRCGYCRRAVGDVLAMLEADGGIRLVLKEFPFWERNPGRPRGRASLLPSRIAATAFWSFTLHCSASGGSLTRERVLSLAVEAGLDRQQLEADLDNPAIDATIQQNYALAEALGINGTPAFIMGDEVAPGYLSQDQLLDWARRLRTGS